MTLIYVSEPEVINIQELENTFEDSNFVFYPGSVKFKNSLEKPYEVLVFRTATIIDDTIKKSFPNLKSVIRIGTGLDNVDLEYCKNASIEVYNAPGANADAVSDYTICMMMLALRKINNLTDKDIMDWNRFNFVGKSVKDQVIGIVGFGNIGRLLYKKLSGFSCKTFFAYDPFLTQADLPQNVKLVSFDDLLKNSTVISLHLPLNKETKYIINETNIKYIKKDSILINAARGGIVDEQAVLQNAKQQNLTYICDTVENEPNINPDLLNNENIIVTPHMASLTTSTETEMIKVAIANFLNKTTARL